MYRFLHDIVGLKVNASIKLLGIKNPSSSSFSSFEFSFVLKDSSLILFFFSGDCNSIIYEFGKSFSLISNS